MEKTLKDIVSVDGCCVSLNCVVENKERIRAGRSKRIKSQNGEEG
jgi:hypothetical protein